MQTAEFNYEDFSKPRAGDEKLAIRFFIKAKQDGEESGKQGRPIFKEHEFIQIMIPGDRNHIVVRPVSPADKDRFRLQYEHWQKTQSNELSSGTSLEAWGVLNLAQIEEFRYFGIRTIEHMADLRDDLCTKILGAVELKQRAAQFLSLAKDEAPLKKVQSELVSRDNQIATLQAALADQGKIIQELAQKAGVPIPQPTQPPAPTAAAIRRRT